MPVNADIQNGDVLVTSGIDGTYPPGLPVAVVSNIERNAAYAFARITCTPAAGVSSYRPGADPVRLTTASRQPAGRRGSRAKPRKSAGRGMMRVLRAAAGPLNPQEILLPVKIALHRLTLVAALLLNLIAAARLVLQLLRPDFIALTLHLLGRVPSAPGRLPAGVAARPGHGRGRRQPVRPARTGLRGDDVSARSCCTAASSCSGCATRSCTCWRSSPPRRPIMLLVRLMDGRRISRACCISLPASLGALLWPLLFSLIRIPLRPRADPDAV